MLQGRASLARGVVPGSAVFKEPQNCMGELGATSKGENGKGQLLCAERGVLLPACPLTGKMEMGIGMKIIMIIVQYLCCVLYVFITLESSQ